MVEIIQNKKINLQERHKNVRRICGEISLAKDKEGQLAATQKEISVRSFIRDWAWWFGTREIRWEDWSDICQEGLDLTLKFIESDAEDYKELEECQKLMEKKVERKGELFKSDKYTEDEKDAWFEMGY